MANKIKDHGSYAFDQDHVDTKVKEKHGLGESLRGFFSSRYAILSILLGIVGIVILVMTASLQFSGASIEASTDSNGISREYTVAAPRGEIVDANGVVLAYSKEVSTLLISNTEMKDLEFNQMLLELSYLFDQYNVTPVQELPDYLSVDPFTFNKEDLDEIFSWQINKNLFNLTEPVSGTVVTYSDKYVKNDPQVFFLYLRKKFKVDSTYSTEEAYRIVKIRYQIFKDNWAFLTGKPIKIATDVPQELIDLLLEQNYKYMGIVSGKDYRRMYTPQAQVASHVVGYIGKIPQETLTDLKNMGYTADDFMGMSGVELQMERYLHPQSGTSSYNVWTDKNEKGTFYPENIGVEALAGAKVTLTIDSKLQKVALDSIKNFIIEQKAKEDMKPKEEQWKTSTAGALVAINVRNGAVLTDVSFPDFDPNDFVLSTEGDKAAAEKIKYYLGLGKNKEITQEDMPLWNRSIASRYAPGSTFKMVTAVAGLETGKILPSTEIICKSPIDIKGQKFTCIETDDVGGHGPLTLNQALAVSCNIYFERLGADDTTGVAVGIDAIDQWGKNLGLGELSGIDLPGEIPGFRASRETKKLLRKTAGDKEWMPADTAQSAIGQFDNSFTILQLARYTAALATNNLVTPHVIKEVTTEDGSIVYQGSTDVQSAGLSDSTVQAIREAMIGVAANASGTAHDAFLNFPISVACKTGTAETGFEKNKEHSNGLFICYAPAENPEIAIALVMENSEWGKETIGIAKNILLAYFNEKDPNVPSTIDSEPILGDLVDPTLVPTSSSN